MLSHICRSLTVAVLLAKVPLALPDMPVYVKEIESIRSLQFKHPVANGEQSLADFRRFVEKDIDFDLPPPKAACVSRALGKLGLLPERFDLRKSLSQLLVTQVAAYYNPYQKTFFILHPELPDSFLRPTVIHELTHALQDQQFELGARIKALQKADNEDVTNAFRFLAEGEATYVMMLSMLHAGGTDLDGNREIVDAAIDTTSRLGRKGIIEQVQATKQMLGPEMAGEIDAVLNYPDYLFRLLFDPYFAGQKAVHHVYREGGWDSVNELWRNPPSSTEMFLHPEKLEKGKREVPVRVEVADLSSALGPGYAATCENTLGELETEILFETILPPAGGGAFAEDTDKARSERALRAAAGWGGDRYRSFERNGGDTVVVWRTVWDTEQDAIEFEEAMRQASRARVARLSAPKAGAGAGVGAGVGAGAASEAGVASKGAPGSAATSLGASDRPGGSPSIPSPAGSVAAHSTAVPGDTPAAIATRSALPGATAPVAAGTSSATAAHSDAAPHSDADGSSATAARSSAAGALLATAPHSATATPSTTAPHSAVAPPSANAPHSDTTPSSSTTTRSTKAAADLSVLAPPEWIGLPASPVSTGAEPSSSGSTGSKTSPPGLTGSNPTSPGYLVVRRGKEAIFVAGAVLDQALALMAAMPLTAPSSPPTSPSQ